MPLMCLFTSTCTSPSVTFILPSVLGPQSCNWILSSCACCSYLSHKEKLYIYKYRAHPCLFILVCFFEIFEISWFFLPPILPLILVLIYSLFVFLFYSLSVTMLSVSWFPEVLIKALRWATHRQKEESAEAHSMFTNGAEVGICQLWP